GHLHTDKPVTKLADLEGMKIRRPTDVIGELLSELGAEPVGMPAPQIYESMQRGTIDGYMLPWEAVDGFRAYEVSDHHTQFGFYALAFVATMNKATYENLPADLKAVIDDNSGMKWSLVAGRGYDEADKVGIAKIEETGGAIHEIDAGQRAAWEAAAERATQSYLDELEEMGLPGRETYAQIEDYVAECRAEI
ncbi:MAG: C4-dicarboxylate ABC transporter substrate-binding protein, partial [Gammaproteobacteria bacterium]|nr:C4-dicarboxylate ABC transporter substrate-binding protein [Gammaproteobacteria bacterium]